MPSYKNLVFKGGGVRGIAYIGALEFLYQQGLMRSVERTAGTSAGAITATVVALNIQRFETIKAISDSLEYKRVPSEGPLSSEHATFLKANPVTLRQQFRGFFRNVQCPLRLVQNMGWYSSEYFYDWIRTTISQQFTVGKEQYTFADFKNEKIHVDERPFFDLYITGTDVSNRTSRVFSYETTPDMEVALAVRISMSIPLYFESVQYQYPGTLQPQFYADGGVMWNYPLSLFDDPKYGKKFSNGLNAETLGFFMFTSPEDTEYKEVKNIVEYLSALFDSLLLVQEQLVLYGEKNKGRTVFINDMGVPSTNFDIETGDATYAKLYGSGYKAAQDFFAGRSNWDMLLHKIRTRFGWKGAAY